MKGIAGYIQQTVNLLFNTFFFKCLTLLLG